MREGRYVWAFELALRAATRLPRTSSAAKSLVEWAQRFHLDTQEGAADAPFWTEEDGDTETVSWSAFQQYLGRRAERRDDFAAAVNLSTEKFCLSLGCNEAERAIVALSLMLCLDPDAERVFALVTSDLDLSTPEAVAMFTGLRRREIAYALSHRSRIVRAGIIQRRPERRYAPHLEMPDRLVEALIQSTGSPSAMTDTLFGVAPNTHLSLDDYHHISSDRDLALAILRGSLAEQAAGVNILLYGAPGVGKTELCSVLANGVDAALRIVALSSEDEKEPDRQLRLREYQLAQNLLPSNQRNLILFDELEDLTQSMGLGSVFLGGDSSGGSKAFINRMFETNPIPTLWTTNSIEHVDPAFLRRMTMVIEIPRPTVTARAKVWQTVARGAGLELSAVQVDDLARRFDAPPGLIATAARGARLAGGNASDLNRLLTASTRVQEITQPCASVAAELDLSLFNTDIDLGVLSRRLCDVDRRTFSLCLYGAPGTGKTAYAHYLAEQMGMPIMQRRASDLLGMFVGESEKNISRAFREAEREGAFLIFDEADSLLATRKTAQHRWEVSQVNEMLAWMERHPLPFACTTNLIDTLDPASARRFTFKIEFNPLSQVQIVAAFDRCFSCRAPGFLVTAGALTLGDFAAVKRKAELLGERGAVEIANMLLSEQAYCGVPSDEYGFATLGNA